MDQLKFLLEENYRLRKELDDLKKEKDYLETLRKNYVDNRITEINSNIRKERAASWVM